MPSPLQQKLASRSNGVWIACCLAGTTQIVLVALLIGIVTKNSLLHSSIGGIAWAASIAHIVVLVVLPATAFFSLRRTTGMVQTIVSALSVLFAVLAAILSIYVFAKVWKSLAPTVANDVDVQTVRSLTVAGFAVWSIAVVAQAALYALLFWPTNEHDNSATSTAEEARARPSPVRSIKHSISVQLSALSPPSTPQLNRSSEPDSPTLPTVRSNSTASFRNSMEKVVRPMTSKTKLLLQKAQDSYSLNSGRCTSLDTIGQEEDFGDWATTRPDDIVPIPKEPDTRPPTRTKLSSIPGSRPVSPANPLNGPFPDSPPEPCYCPESYHPRPVTSPTPSRPSRMSPDPNRYRPVTSPTSDRASSRMSTRSSRSDSVREREDQRKIHPLFRSESPAPAPAIHSPNTNVYGHPQGGTFVVNEDEFEELGLPRNLHSAQGCRPESPGSMAGRARPGGPRRGSAPLEGFWVARTGAGVVMGGEAREGKGWV